MHYQKLLSLTTILLSTLHIHLTTASPTPKPTPFSLTYLFSVAFQIGHYPPEIEEHPVLVPGGEMVPEPVLGGMVRGPYMNGTLLSGLAMPRLYDNGAVQDAVVEFYEVTEDGYAFHGHEVGIESQANLATRILRTLFLPLYIYIGGGIDADH